RDPGSLRGESCPSLAVGSLLDALAGSTCPTQCDRLQFPATPPGEPMDSTRPGLDSTIKRLAALLSGGAALVSILSFLVGRRSAPDLVAGMSVAEVDRLDLLPTTDTAFALGDTVRLTALAADARGRAVLPTSI